MFLCFFVLFHFINACVPTKDTCFTFCVPPPSLAPPPPTPSPMTITVTKTEKETEKETITDEITLTLTSTTTDLVIPEETGDIPPFVFFPVEPSSVETTFSEEVKSLDTILKSYEQASSSTLVECVTDLPEEE